MCIKTCLERWEQLKGASKAMVAAINEEFPVGSRIRVKVGRGYMRGVVSAECYGGTRVIVRSDAGGKVHHKHFVDVQHE